MFPVEDEKLLERIMHVLKIQLEDNVKTHILQPDGTWRSRIKGKDPDQLQEQFVRRHPCMSGRTWQAGSGWQQGFYSD